MKRLLSLPILALLSSLLTTTTVAHNIQMGAHSRACFHEMLHKDDKMTVTFQVGDREFGGAGNLELDFWVRWLVSFALGMNWGYWAGWLGGMTACWSQRSGESSGNPPHCPSLPAFTPL